MPGEDSTGEKHRRGRITRAGNALVRRLLVETAWHYQHRPGIGVALDATAHRTAGPGDRDRGQGAAALVSPLPAPGGRHKPAPKIVVAIARELVGFLWAALQPAPAPMNGADVGDDRTTRDRR